MIQEELLSRHKIFIPPSLPKILKNYAKSAIRTQPRDLLLWSRHYFRAMAEDRPPPVKRHLEVPPLREALSGLSPGLLRVLISQIGDMNEVPKEIIADKWEGICLEKKYLEILLKIGKFSDPIEWDKFVAIAAGSIEKELRGTMLLLLELLGDAEGRLEVELCLELYKYLASLDCGPTQQSTSAQDQNGNSLEVAEDEGHNEKVNSTEGNETVSEEKHLDLHEEIQPSEQKTLTLGEELKVEAKDEEMPLIEGDQPHSEAQVEGELSQSEAKDRDLPQSDGLSEDSPSRIKTQSEAEVKSELHQSEADVTSELPQSEADVKSELPQSETEVRNELSQSETDVISELHQSEADITSEIPQSEADVTSELPQSETEVRNELSQSETDVISELHQSEADITSEIPQSEADVTSELHQSEAEVKSELPRSEPDVKSEIPQTETEVKRKISQSEAEVRSELPQSEAEVTSEIPQSEAEVTIELPQSEADVRSEFPQSEDDDKVDAESEAKEPQTEAISENNEKLENVSEAVENVELPVSEPQGNSEMPLSDAEVDSGKPVNQSVDRNDLHDKSSDDSGLPPSETAEPQSEAHLVKTPSSPSRSEANTLQERSQDEVEDVASSEEAMELPGIGPVVPLSIVEKVEAYLRRCAAHQSDMVIPRNFRHHLCPPLY